MNQGQSWSLRRDLDPRPLPYQSPKFIEPMSFRSFDWSAFKAFVYGKYAKSNAPKVMCYANRYYHVLESGNIGQLNSVPATTRTDAIKSLDHNLQIHRMLRAIQSISEKLRNQACQTRRACRLRKNLQQHK